MNKNKNHKGFGCWKIDDNNNKKNSNKNNNDNKNIRTIRGFGAGK